MAFLSFASLAGDTTLGAAITSTTATSVTLAAGGGAILQNFISHELNPNPGSGVMIGIGTELLIVTQIVGDVLTVVRGAHSTTAATASNAAAVHLVTPASVYLVLAAGLAAAAPGS